MRADDTDPLGPGFEHTAPPPASVEEALAKARAHARAAGAEALAAARALLDAASLATTGQPSESGRLLRLMAHGLDDLSRALAGDGTGASPLLAAVAEALDSEIARWEERAQDEPDARAVLRAYLGLREILWELGVRRASPSRDSAPSAGRPGGSAPRAPEPRSARLERVPVEG